MSKPRVRNFCGVVYQEDCKQLLDFFKDYTNRGIIRSWYFIKHNAESEEKQVHFHFLVEFYNAKTLSAVDKLTGLRVGKTETCSDIRSYACYMLHKYEIDKERYYQACVESNDKERFNLLVTASNDNEICNDKLVFYKFSNLCLNNDLPLYAIFENLCRDKEVQIKYVRKNAFLFKVYYESYKTEGRGFKYERQS